MLGFLAVLVIVGIVLYFVLRGRNQRKSRPKTAGNSPSKATRTNATKSQEDLTFIVNGKEPETDSDGCVIVRLGAGANHEISVPLFADDFAVMCYLLGKPKEEVFDISRTVRARVRRVVGRAGAFHFEVRTPEGAHISDIDNGASRDAATLVLGTVEEYLRSYNEHLADRQFIFDVALKIENGEWNRDEDEESGWIGEADAYLRIKDPAEIDIR